MYSRHLASLESGEHLWASLLVPWWMIAVGALAPAAWVGWRGVRAKSSDRAGADTPESHDTV
jgi:hypothetical protein